jgi:hypothetical protein
LDKLEQETTGQKDIIQKVLNLLIQFSMLLEKKLKVATVYKDSKSPTLLEEELVLVWELF